MTRSHIKDFTQGSITQQLIVFAWPLFLSNLLQVVYNMVDMVVVGHTLGKVGISAVAVGGDVSASVEAALAEIEKRDAAARALAEAWRP